MRNVIARSPRLSRDAIPRGVVYPRMKIAHYLLLLCTLLLLRVALAEEPLTLETVKQWATLPPTMIEGTVAITGEEDWKLDFRAYYDAESEAIRLSNKSGTVLVHYHPDFGGSHIWIDGRPDFFDSKADRLQGPVSMFRPLGHFHQLVNQIENADGRSNATVDGTLTSGTVTVQTTAYGFRARASIIKHTIRNRKLTSNEFIPSRATTPRLTREFSRFGTDLLWVPRQILITRQLGNATPEYSIKATIDSAKYATSSEAALGELRAGLTQFWPPYVHPTGGGLTPRGRSLFVWSIRGIAAVLVLIAVALYWYRRNFPGYG